jgi:putative ABC transport system permease protein
MEIRIVSAPYFETMGIPIRQGRSFGAQDTETSPPAILVNETVARQWWPGGEWAGSHVLMGWKIPRARWWAWRATPRAST